MRMKRILSGSVAIVILFLTINTTLGSLEVDVLEFKVDKGAKKIYTFIHYLNEDAMEDELEINNESGVQQVVTITKGVKITVEITDVTNDEVEYQLTIDGIKSEKCKEGYAILFHLKELDVTFLQQAIVNRSYWETKVEEFKDQYKTFKSQVENFSGHFDYSAEISGDFLIFELNGEYENNSMLVWNKWKTSFNWKTGWLNYHYINYSEYHEGKSLIEVKVNNNGLLGLPIPGYEVNLAVVGLSFSVLMGGIYKKRKQNKREV